MTVVSQAAGFVVLLVAVAIRGSIGWHSFALGLLAGVGGGAGLAAFYRALSLGTMSVVSPVAACGAVVPFAIALATGERPSVIALAGAAAALGGAVLASLEERHGDSPERARAIALAVVAAVALGLFVYFLGLGSRDGDALSTLTGARVASLALLVTLALARGATLRLPARRCSPSPASDWRTSRRTRSSPSPRATACSPSSRSSARSTRSSPCCSPRSSSASA